MEQSESDGVPQSGEHRVRRTPEQWRALVEAHPASGMGVEAYCRQQGITSSCFYRWRRFLSGVSGAASPWAGHKKRRPAAPLAFAQVKVVEDHPVDDGPIRLRLAGGRELVLSASITTGRLVELLLALEARS